MENLEMIPIATATGSQFTQMYIRTKSSIIDIWQVPDYAPGSYKYRHS